MNKCEYSTNSRVGSIAYLCSEYLVKLSRDPQPYTLARGVTKVSDFGVRTWLTHGESGAERGAMAPTYRSPPTCRARALTTSTFDESGPLKEINLSRHK